MASSNGPVIQFVQFNSFVDASFWWKLTDHKLNVYKLDESEKPFKAYYANCENQNNFCFYPMNSDFNINL